MQERPSTPPTRENPGAFDLLEKFWSNKIPHYVASFTIKCPNGWAFTEHQIPHALDV